MNLDDKLSEGRHTVEMKFRGVVEVDKGEAMTVAEAIDNAQPGASLTDWSIDGD